jgi:hypothetical protein
MNGLRAKDGSDRSARAAQLRGQGPSLPQALILMLLVIVGGYLLYTTANRTYFTPRAKLVSDIESVRAAVTDYRAALDRRAWLDAQLRSYVDRSLGADVETVDHRLRTRLNRIAEEVGLNSVTVSTSSPTAFPSPARATIRSAAFRELRDEVDFVEVPGAISAEGTLAQHVELLDRLNAEPWLKRVPTARLDPRDGGQRFNITVRLTTIFLPGREAGQGTLIASSGSYDRSRLARFASLTAGNPFRLPPPPEPRPEPEQRVEQRPSGPPPFPYGQWILTGIAEGTYGEEAWLTNRRSGESRRIAVGEELAQIRFIAARGEHGEFAQGDERFLVAVGSNLNDRTPLSR